MREREREKQKQSDTCAGHIELQQNTEHLTQRITALTQQLRTLQTEKDSYQCELTTLKLQLQDREQATLEQQNSEIRAQNEQMREIQKERQQQNSEIRALKEQVREIQEEREQQNSEIRALKEQVKELLLAKEDPEKTPRAQTLSSTSDSQNTGNQHPPLSAARPDPDSSQPPQRPLSGSSTQQHQSLSHSSQTPTNTEEAEIALLIDSNGKFIDINKLFPQHRAAKFWCPTTNKALELLTESQLGRPSHIIIHTGTNDLRRQQDRVSDSLKAVVEKARKNFPNSKIILSTLLQRKDFHPNTIHKINSSISRHCALLPNVHLAHHPDLDTDCLYDHVHLYKSLVNILAKRLKDITLNRRTQTSPRWSRDSPNSANPTRHTSSRAPAGASAPRQDPYSQRLSHTSPIATAAEARPQQGPAQPGRPSYAQVVSGGANRTNADLHDIQQLLRIICSHLQPHSGRW